MCNVYQSYNGVARGPRRTNWPPPWLAAPADIAPVESLAESKQAFAEALPPAVGAPTPDPADDDPPGWDDAHEPPPDDDIPDPREIGCPDRDPPPPDWPSGEADPEPPAAESNAEPQAAAWDWWELASAADLAHLNRPLPEPCPWCGGRLRHHPHCVSRSPEWRIKMPWGKHKGKPVDDVPRDYLRWLLAKDVGKDKLPSYLDDAIRRTLRERPPEFGRI